MNGEDSKLWVLDMKLSDDVVCSSLACTVGNALEWPLFEVADAANNCGDVDEFGGAGFL